MDQFLAIGKEMVSIMATLWGMVEVLGAHSRAKPFKPMIALLVGPVAGVVAFRLGYLTSLPPCSGPHCQILSAAFAGEILMMGTMLAHAYGIKPLLTKLQGPAAPPDPPASLPPAAA